MWKLVMYLCGKLSGVIGMCPNTTNEMAITFAQSTQLILFGIVILSIFLNYKALFLQKYK